MAKEIVGYIKLQRKGGQANPAPPVGPALGQKGVNIMEFCKTFNAETQGTEPGLPIPVIITAYADRSFSFITKTPPASFFIKKAAGLPKGASDVGREIVGRVKKSQVREIAEAKMPDLNAASMETAMSMIAGTARSMGLLVDTPVPVGEAEE
mgnify:CR=1 FL=1